ncbi:hypothetical protein ERJ75_000767700 [Trypanosoma vivax]|uniref:Uncharacterized protein n=1 Tax=Trypanosoma vivax (strain Y486) TaxID=1055687 RepID=G0U3R1_TRYVY|nr:hypothetical protein TRVL_03748 [Trypanosoma vivax]KAH8614131.1 hypothetical protein ERJ75_000767700 [Trypanosoma vivax]CCC50920.1 conserved hypothetical protein [Trypanosoma vivax Y486]
MKPSSSFPLLPDFVRHRDSDGESYISTRGRYSDPCDLVTKDGRVVAMTHVNSCEVQVTVLCTNVPQKFRGFADGVGTEFVLKASLAQLGVIAEEVSIKLSPECQEVTVDVKLLALSKLAESVLNCIEEGTYLGKLFAVDRVRKVRDIAYVDRLLRMMDQDGEQLLSYGDGSDPQWDLKLVSGRVVAFLPVCGGAFTYSDAIKSHLATIKAALGAGKGYKGLLRYHQELDSSRPRVARSGEVLVLRSYPMCLRTMFARVAVDLLPPGLRLLSTSIVEPTPAGSRKPQDITFAFYGESQTDLTHVPVEFFTVESYREYVPYELRKTLAKRCMSKGDVLRAFSTAPKGETCCCTFICKGGQFDELRTDDWIVAYPKDVPSLTSDNPEQRRKKAQQKIRLQCEYRILSAIAAGDITSEGVLLTRYFPSPCLKSLVLSCSVGQKMRAIYFTRASKRFGDFFGLDDHGFLRDLDESGIDVFLVDERHEDILQFVRRPERDVGLFVPLGRRADYTNATFFGVYGSNLVEGNFERELHYLFEGIIRLKETSNHELLNSTKSLALTTGGGPGAMEVGNRVAKSLGILSCGLIVDFGTLATKPGATINEQKQNPYVDAFMTYRADKLVERQSDFNLDFPIFLTGGIGTDFEYALEEVRRKVGSVRPTPMILFGDTEYFRSKITWRYQANLKSGTIKGSEWISNVPWVVTTGHEALQVYTHFFSGRLPVGPAHPANDCGFVVASAYFSSNPS